MLTIPGICLQFPLAFSSLYVSISLYLHLSIFPSYEDPSHCISRYCCCLVTKSCLTLCNPIDCSPPGSSVHGVSQARILEWVSIFFYRGSSWPRDWTHVSCLAGRFLTTEPPGKPSHCTRAQPTSVWSTLTLLHLQRPYFQTRSYSQV